MIAAGSLEYAHARIWARHGQRPPEPFWRRIETTRELGAVLELARGSTLAAWLEGVGAAAGVHAIEAALRRHWRERVHEVATWMPPQWGPAIEWCSVLIDLPALLHLARGGQAPPWLEADAQLRPLRDGGPPALPALRSLLDAARNTPQDLLPLWTAGWQRCLPQAGRRAVIARLLPLLSAHAIAMGSPQAVDGWALRRSLQARLQLLLRRSLIEPVTAFVYLALSALEFERLRGELLRRATFPQRWVAP